MSLNLQKAIVLLGLALGLVTCSPSVPKRIAEPDNRGEKVIDDKDIEEAYAAVDVLFVVDNSYSMSTHQANLAANISRFVASFSQMSSIDYHIGVLTTDTDSPGAQDCCGQLIPNPIFIDPSMPNGVQALAKNLVVGLMGSPTEMSFEPVIEALSPPNSTGWNKGFYRPDAHLAVIFITDAEDQSTVSPSYFYDYLVKLKGTADKILGYGAIVPSGANTAVCPRDDSRTPPARIETFLGMVSNAGNNVMSLCDPDFGGRLAQMSDDLVHYVGSIIYLKRPPVLSSIKVSFGTQSIPKDLKVGWSFDLSRNAIILGDGIQWSTQPLGTKIRVFYESSLYKPRAI